MVLGSALVIGSTFLIWFTFTATGFGSQDVKGIGNEEGALSMALGAIGLAAIVLVLGLILAIRGRGRGLAIGGAIVSVFLLFVGGYASFATEQAIVAFEAKEFGEAGGISESEAKRQLEEAFERNLFEATPGVGAYVAFGGAVLAMVGSIAGIAMGGRKAEVAYAPPPPPTGYAPPPPPVAPPTEGYPPPAGPPAAPPPQ